MKSKQKQHMNIRNKLMAAVAMLLVSSIMMVSTTYAWFTLSTAPEVQGITTTVGANGNLEIALAPYSGLGTDVTESTVGSSNLDWVAKNLTWGNLLDLSDESYGLDKLTLLPAQLMAVPGADKNTLNDSPLAIPNYGVDGRITMLSPDTIIGGREQTTTTSGEGEGAVTTVTLSEGYTATGGSGIRAVGTASTMSERQLAFSSNLTAIKNNAALANRKASASLSANGAALANIMIAHAQAGDSDGNNYVDYVDDLQALTAALSESVELMAEALRSALLAAAATQAESDEDFAGTNTVIKGLSYDTLFNTEGDYAALYNLNTALSTAVSTWNTINTNVTAANAAAADLTDETFVGWSQLGTLLGYLMNTNGTVTINEYTVDTIKNNMNNYNFLLGLAKDTKITLGAGSGVYYDISLMTGKITSTMTAAVSFQGDTIDLAASIVTPDVAASTLNTLYTGINILGSGTTWGEGSAMIDTFYGYVVDFMFRTNVSGSNLMLQTEGAQRIYADGTNEETMGNGSTITFTLSNTLTANTARGLVEAMHVAFFDPDTKELYGIAKVTDTSTATEGSVETLTGNLELWSYTAAADTKYVTMGDTKAASAAICALDQNTVKEVSVLVFLDGEKVTNADVLNDGNIEATLNLQFSSSATLKPMNNTALMNGSDDVEAPTPSPSPAPDTSDDQQEPNEP